MHMTDFIPSSRMRGGCNMGARAPSFFYLKLKKHSTVCKVYISAPLAFLLLKTWIFFTYFCQNNTNLFDPGPLQPLRHVKFLPS